MKKDETIGIERLMQPIVDKTVDCKKIFGTSIGLLNLRLKGPRQ